MSKGRGTFQGGIDYAMELMEHAEVAMRRAGRSAGRRKLCASPSGKRQRSAGGSNRQIRAKTGSIDLRFDLGFSIFDCKFSNQEPNFMKSLHIHEYIRPII
jgi:hypothetical protein